MHPCFSDVLSPCSLRRCSRSHLCSPSVLPNVINDNVLYLLYLGLPTIIPQKMETNNSIRPVQSPSNPIALLTAFSSLPFACITAFEALGSEQAQLLAISHLLQPRPPPPSACSSATRLFTAPSESRSSSDQAYCHHLSLRLLLISSFNNNNARSRRSTHLRCLAYIFALPISDAAVIVLSASLVGSQLHLSAVHHQTKLIAFRFALCLFFVQQQQ